LIFNWHLVVAHTYRAQCDIQCAVTRMTFGTSITLGIYHFTVLGILKTLSLALWNILLLPTLAILCAEEHDKLSSCTAAPSGHFPFVFALFGGIGVWTQGLALAMQMLYHLSHAPVLFAAVIF
jgi:hypothetical protein